MKRMKEGCGGLAATLALVALTACAGIQTPTAPPLPKAPDQIVFDLKASEGVALAIFVRYKAFPRCPAQPICSDPAIVAKVQAADVVAAKAIDTAESAVRTPGFGKDTIATLIASAQAAGSYLTSVTAPLKGN